MKDKSFGEKFITYLVQDEFETFKDIMVSTNASYWKEAIIDEYESII